MYILESMNKEPAKMYFALYMKINDFEIHITQIRKTTQCYFIFFNIHNCTNLNLDFRSPRLNPITDPF